MNTSTELPGARRSLNAHLIGDQNGRSRLSTPALLLDLDVLETNIARMQNYCRAHGMALRPHLKCHKSMDIARLQIASGAIGVCCATIGEAEVAAAAGITGIMITSPVVAEGKIGRAVKISELDDRLCLVIDNPDNAAAISAAFVAAGRKVAVLVDVDAGMQRTGVADQKAAIDLARRAQDLPGLNYVGLQCYAGHLQHIENPDERQQEALSVMGSLRVLIEELKQCGLAPQIVSGGGTGTFDIDGPAGVLTELQAGSYALMDDQYNRVWTECGQSPPFEVALFVQSSVISNNHAGIATCDAGLKHFGVDGGVPVVARGATDGATYLYAGDEHGRIMLASRDDRLELNSRIEFVVPHCDPTVNLYDHLHCVRGETLVDVWPIGARGA